MSITQTTVQTSAATNSLTVNGEERFVATKLKYASTPTDGSKPYTKTYVVDPTTGEWERNWKEEEHDVQVQDLRGKENSVSLDTNGFQFGTHATKVQKAFHDETEIREVYYPESIELIKSVTGATRVVVFDHTIRRHVPGESGVDENKRQPVMMAHVDQTPASAEARVYRHLPAEEAPELAKKRYQIINLWRPISNPAWALPLALCDYSSVDFKKDFVPASLVYPDRAGETFNIAHNPNHRWKYVSGLRPDQYVLIKCSETQEGVARFTPHTAFVDPSTPADAPLRESIEMRTIVFYD